MIFQIIYQFLQLVKKYHLRKYILKEKLEKLMAAMHNILVLVYQSRLNSKLSFDQLTSVNLQLELLYETFHAVLEDHDPLINPSRKQQQYLKSHE